MKERPIAFSKPMVQATYEGRKTQTRRTMNPQPTSFFHGPDLIDDLKKEQPHIEWGWNTRNKKFPSEEFWADGDSEEWQKYCPYGKVGDILWVKETYYQRGSWRKNGVTKKGNQKWEFKPADDIVLFENTKPSLFEKSRNKEYPTTKMWYKRLGRFMPKKYARLYLEIKKIRVEQIKDISFDDALAEGLKKFGRGERAKYGLDGWVESYSVPCKGCHTLDDKPWRAFAQLWQGINGLDSWNDNPWVWVIEFKVQRYQYTTTHYRKKVK